jgi:hypothetical protein
MQLLAPHLVNEFVQLKPQVQSMGTKFALGYVHALRSAFVALLVNMLMMKVVHCAAVVHVVQSALQISFAQVPFT